MENVLFRKNFTQDRKLHIVTLFADGGEMYEDSYFNEAWISEHYKNPKSLHILHCWRGVLETSFSTGKLNLCFAYKNQI